jgi:hypothetical protein
MGERFLEFADDVVPQGNRLDDRDGRLNEGFSGAHPVERVVEYVGRIKCGG